MEEINVVETMEMVEDFVDSPEATSNFAKGAAFIVGLELLAGAIYVGGKWVVKKVTDAKAKKEATEEPIDVLDDEE